MRGLLLAVVLCGLGSGLCVSSRAAAHVFPTSFGVVFDPGDPRRMVVLLRPGAALSDDAGASWDFLCGAAMGIAGDNPFPALLSDGHLLVGAFAGLYRDEGFGCGWSRVEHTGLPRGRVVSLLARADGDVDALIASSGGQGLYVSGDHGQSWSPRTAALPMMEPLDLAHAPAGSYLLGVQSNASTATLWVSHDGGETWVERPPLETLCTQILAVDASEAPRVFLRCAGDTMERVLMSADDGEHFTSFIELPEISGLATSPDWSSVWIGSRAGGLWRADGSGAPQLLHADIHVGCVKYERDVLWVCGRDEPGFDAFALASSRDRGQTLTPLVRATQVSRLRTCGNPLQAMTCGSEWNQWQADLLAMPQRELDAGAPVRAPMTQSRQSARVAGCQIQPAPRRWPLPELTLFAALFGFMLRTRVPKKKRN